MKLRTLSRPRYLARRFVQKLGGGLRRARLGRLIELMSVPPPDPYVQWMTLHDPRAYERREAAAIISLMRSAPTISVCMPVCDPPPAYLREAIASVRDQWYPHWQLCIADDASTQPEVIALLASLADDPRIRVIRSDTRRGIAAATNDALTRASGEFTAFLDHDDMLAPHALYRFAIAIAADPRCDVIYSDEDKIDENPAHRFDPYFKPDWSPETLLAKMYVGHLLAIRRSLVEAVGGMRSRFDGSQDYDLVLRATERADRIVHIPDVLYHWRAHRGSAAQRTDAKPFAIEAGAAGLARRARPARRSGDRRTRRAAHRPVSRAIRARR